MVNSFFEALYPSAHNEKSFFTERRAESPPYNSTGQRPVVWALPPSIPEALTGRNHITRISPFQGLFIVHFFFGRALPCAIDLRAFSPSLAESHH
ncbi:MAG: hypothetical protein LBS01_04600, partial [Prevotellaceae bacterium]|nr:hypothetical protein [Prevotellaceae bacterium]